MAEEQLEHKVIIIGGSAGSVTLLMEIIGKIPLKVKESAEVVFKKVCIEIKKNCLMLLTLESSATRLGMSKEELKKSVIEMLNITF